MSGDKVSWKDTNLALIGSDLDHKVKAAAAQGEDAWKGIGEQPEVRVWRIEKFEVKPWPQERYGDFCKGDSYIVLKTYKEEGSDSLQHDLHIWIGSESTQDEYGTAAYKMVEADDYLGGIPVEHRQVEGRESAEFRSLFDGLRYLEGGVESGFNHVEPTVEKPMLFRVKSSGKQVLMTQMPVSKNSLNEGDSFILSVGKDAAWCWNGKDSRPMEKITCNQAAEKMCPLGTVTVLGQGDGDEDDKQFWEYLGDGEISTAKEAEKEVTDFTPMLYRVDGDQSKDLELVAKGSLTQKPGKIVKCLDKEALAIDDVFLMDSGWELFIWIGKAADRNEKIAAMSAADRYSRMEPRASELPVTIIKSGHETALFNAYFGV